MNVVVLMGVPDHTRWAAAEHALRTPFIVTTVGVPRRIPLG
jgi:hypothetical protein